MYTYKKQLSFVFIFLYVWQFQSFIFDNHETSIRRVVSFYRQFYFPSFPLASIHTHTHITKTKNSYVKLMIEYNTRTDRLSYMHMLTFFLSVIIRHWTVFIRISHTYINLLLVNSFFYNSNVNWLLIVSHSSYYANVSNYIQVHQTMIRWMTWIKNLFFCSLFFT
jgi:hypothetical protein